MSEDPFESIRRNFIASLPLRAARLHAIIEQEHGFTREAKRMLREQLHQLAGSAAVFGIVPVMERAQHMSKKIQGYDSSDEQSPDSEIAGAAVDLEEFIRFLELAEV